MSEPKIVTDSIVDQNGTTTENELNIFPLTICRYAWLEKVDSPFLNTSKKFELNSIIPSAYIMAQTPKQLRKYTSKDISELIADSYEWADESLKLDDIPELIKVILDQMNALNKAAPSGSSSGNGDVDLGSGKKND